MGIKYEHSYFQASDFDLIISLSTIIIGFLFLLGVFYFVTNFNKVKEISIPNNFGYVIALIQVMYLVYNLTFQVNTAGVSSYGRAPWYFSYVFILFSSDMLFAIYLFTVKKSKLRTLNSLIYLLSMLQRGWMSGVVLLFINYILESEISKKKFVNTLLLCVTLFFLLPIFVKAKWYFRVLGYDFESFDLYSIFNFDGQYFSYLFTSIEYVINRFQILSTTTYIYLNSIQLEISQHLYKPFYLDGVVMLPLIKVFGIDLPSLNSFIVTDVMGFRGDTWNVNTGFLSWLFISPFYIAVLPVYSVLLILLSQKSPLMQYGWRIIALSLFMILSKLHVGWFAAYVNWVFSLYVFYIMLSLYNRATGIQYK